MIGFLQGTLLDIYSDKFLVVVSGVGYEVFVSKKMMEQNPSIGNQLTLHVHTHVTDDDIRLYGFSNTGEKAFFRKLLSVSGIGPKSAMQVLSAAHIPEIIRAIQTKDLAFLQRCQGIGKKTAERLITELHDKLEAPSSEKIADYNETNTPKSEIISALLNLGYKRHESESVVSGLDFSALNNFDSLLRESLKRLGK